MTDASADTKAARFEEAASEHEKAVEAWRSSTADLLADIIDADTISRLPESVWAAIGQGCELMRARPAPARLPAVLARLSQALGNPCLDFSKTTIEDALVDYAIGKLEDRPATEPADLVARLRKLPTYDRKGVGNVLKCDPNARFVVAEVMDSMCDLATSAPVVPEDVLAKLIARSKAMDCHADDWPEHPINIVADLAKLATSAPVAVQVPEVVVAKAYKFFDNPEAVDAKGLALDLASDIIGIAEGTYGDWGSASEPAPEPESKPSAGLLQAGKAVCAYYADNPNMDSLPVLNKRLVALRQAIAAEAERGAEDTLPPTEESDEPTACDILEEEFGYAEPEPAAERGEDGQVSALANTVGNLLTDASRTLDALRRELARGGDAK